ncbi:hypothetical protein [Brevibacterium album]|uniref:hypothetical protein n=1 Tax=Brevibacterium album TaxID=417948 RepID=UPI00040723C7|nr:hypothetical protein [Brevibacterium album]
MTNAERRGPRPRLKLAPLAALLAVGLAACGGGNAGKPEQADAGAEESAQAPSDPEVLAVEDWRAAATAVPALDD